MTTHQINHDLSQPSFPRANVLGIIFFILGVPNLYAFFKRPVKPRKNGYTARYAAAVLLAGAIAGIVELSVL